MELLKKFVLAGIAPVLALSAFVSCRDGEQIILPEEEHPGETQRIQLTGFYLLNEGNMGSNKSSLDRYSFADGSYLRNIYAQANPDVPKELGDVGNDMAAYGSKLWVVVNCSNKVEVLDLKTARRLGQIDIPNCRYIAFDGRYAYVTSYAGPVEINPDYRQRGFVARIDTATMQETARVEVGFQPDGIAVCDGMIYLANSGGYMVPNYENTVSVIDASEMRFVGNVEIGINLALIAADSGGRLWISSRGDYFDTPSRLYVYDPATRTVLKTFDHPVGDFFMAGDSLYTVSGAIGYSADGKDRQFAIFDIRRLECVNTGFITDGTEKDITVPYGIAVNPVSKEIYITDARNYVNPGYLHCYSPEGVRKWSQRTGDIPSKIVFY